VFDAPGLADAHGHGPAVQYWVLDTQVSGLLGRLDTADRWWAVIIDAPTDAAAWVQQALHRMVGGQNDIQVCSTDPWTARMLVADTYSAGRSYLLGDARTPQPTVGRVRRQHRHR